MKNSIFITNQCIQAVLQKIKGNNIQGALQDCQKGLKSSHSQIVKKNIKVTLAVLHITLHNFQKAEQILQQAFQQIKDQINFKTKSEQQQNQGLNQSKDQINKKDSDLLLELKINCKIMANLILIQIITKKYQQSIYIFNVLVKYIVGFEPKIQLKLINYVSFIYFRTQNLKDFIPNQAYLKQLKKRALTVLQAISISHFFFNQDICGYQCDQQSQQVYIMAYETLKKAKKYDFAFFCLRHLQQIQILLQKNRFYVKQELNWFSESKIISNDTIANNQESIECLRCICQSLKELQLSVTSEDQQLQKDQFLQNNEQTQRIIQKQNQVLWTLTVKINIKQIQNNQFSQQNQKNVILRQMKNMLNEKNSMLIKNLLQSDFIKKTIRQIQRKIDSIFIIFQKNSLSKVFFEKIKNQYLIIKQSKLQPLKQKNTNVKQSTCSINLSNYSFVSRSNRSQSKQNYQFETSSKRKKIFEKLSNEKLNNQTQMQNNIKKKINKMVKLCEYGTFLNKRNFNNDGGQFKFVKINSNFIKWGRNPEKVDQSAQMYPLKDIKGILYGKKSPNLRKPCNKILKDHLCFSLILQKRTLDFYCKDYSEVEMWVCGMTQVLKNKEAKIVGYTPAKLRWKKMFAILRESFIQPLKRHEKNQYYFQDAYSLILFQRNNYSLLKKQ